MRAVRLWDVIEYEATSWQVVACEGTELALRSMMTGSIRKVVAADLLGSQSYLPDTRERDLSLENIRVLDTINSEQKTRVLFLQNHIGELLYGVPPGSPAAVQPRPEYELSRRFMDRIEAKVHELHAAGTPISKRTLWRHISAYRKHGVAGLVDGRKTRRSTPLGSVDARVISLLDAAMAAQQNRSTGTRSRMMAQVTWDAEKEGLQVPSRATMYRAAAYLERGRHPFGNATTRRTQANRPDRVYGRQAPSRPGELVEIDSTPLDLMVIYPDGSRGRADMTIALDLATRTVCAAILRPIATKSVDAAVLLARALTPLPMQPGWDEALSLSRSILPAGMIMDDADLRRRIAARPVIVPESVTIDRGKVYVGATFTAACERLQINIINAAPHTPTDKPHVERAFKAINSGFTQFLAGYTGPNVMLRGKDPAAGAYWTLAQVQDLLDQWLVSVWQNRPHPGVRHPAIPKRDLSPNEMYTAISAVAPSVAVALTRDDYIALLPVAWRAIHPYGINFEGLMYDSPALHPHRGRPSGIDREPARGKWEIRYDPYRLNTIYVHDHLNRAWIEANWTMAAQALGPFSLDVLHAALRVVDKRAGRVAGRDVLAEINRIQLAGAQTVKERKAANRNATTNPIVPTDADMATPQPPEPAHTETRPLRLLKARRIDEDD